MILFSSVTKHFGDRTTALEEISFRIKPGEFAFITGPSGSGKTTIMKLLIKEYLPTQGDVEFDGKSTKKIKGRKLPYHRRNIGVIFQDYKLLPELNIWENIALPLYISRKSQSEIESRVTDLLRLVSIEEKAWLFPSQLSGGESQRVSIARALATGPKVIFADEPTGNLDPKTSLMIAKLLKKINDLGTTLLFATHDQSVLDYFPNEKRIHLKKGESADIEEKVVQNISAKETTQTPANVKKSDGNKEPATTSDEKKETKKEETKPTDHQKNAQGS